LPRCAAVIGIGLKAACAAAALIGLATSAQGQANEKRGTPGDFDFYVLAMSWSPGFCALNPRNDSEQCAPDSDLAFVLHGLWPQYQSGYPAFCSDQQRPTRSQISNAVPPFPSEGLVRHQWRKHGSCSGLDPTAYFALSRRAFAKVKAPESITGTTGQTISPIDIERAFADANPGLTPDRMSVQCRRGLFQEIRICLSKDLARFVPCPEVDRDACRSRTITIEQP
jgi:ribonuclease T2